MIEMFSHESIHLLETMLGIMSFISFCLFISLFTVVHRNETGKQRALAVVYRRTAVSVLHASRRFSVLAFKPESALASCCDGALTFEITAVV